jgi:magnesium chelatase accessory protein
MKARLEWERDGADWPHRGASRFVESGHLIFHVQAFGDPSLPALALLHGTGASTHSWRDFAPLLADRFHVVAMDLPGHGFTRGHRAKDLTLSGMAAAVSGVFDRLGVTPDALIGHSAGCAVAIRMQIDHGVTARRIIGLNAALLPFPGAAGRIFPTMARALFLNPLAPVMFASQANDRSVARLISGTGSHLDARGLALYARLFETSAHVAGAIGMMAQWDLETLNADFSKVTALVVLIVGDRDKAVAPSQADIVKQRLPKVRVITAPGLGHLAHEEAPARIADLVLKELGA